MASRRHLQKYRCWCCLKSLHLLSTLPLGHPRCNQKSRAAHRPACKAAGDQHLFATPTCCPYELSRGCNNSMMIPSALQHASYITPPVECTAAAVPGASMCISPYFVVDSRRLTRRSAPLAVHLIFVLQPRQISTVVLQDTDAIPSNCTSILQSDKLVALSGYVKNEAAPGGGLGARASCTYSHQSLHSWQGS